ncbi:hypothetical protein niasHS_002777 [Heterodera schachtii]|uniref:Uncharacterized protein n=1 Tax=Heterodera schachtii TaxID=97005 RepID=A0ABD2K2E6_HETSC
MGNACLSQSLCSKQQLLLTNKLEMAKTMDELQRRTVKVNTLMTPTKEQQQKQSEQKQQKGGEAAENWAKQNDGGQNAKGNAKDGEGTIGGEMSMRDKEIIARCWRKRIATDRCDFFHKTMLRCIEASPKLNEIIACGRYCYRDLTKWPKLNRICQAQFKFYERLIYELNMDERRMGDQCTRLGKTHAEYAQFGLKPHFLDIYQQSLIALISKMEFADDNEREETINAFGRLIRFIVEAMIEGYGQRVTELRTERRGSGETTEEKGKSDDELKSDRNELQNIP